MSDEVLFDVIDGFEWASMRTEYKCFMSTDGKSIPHTSFQLLPVRLAHIIPGPGTAGHIRVVM